MSRGPFEAMDNVRTSVLPIAEIHHAVTVGALDVGRHDPGIPKALLVPGLHELNAQDGVLLGRVGF